MKIFKLYQLFFFQEPAVMTLLERNIVCPIIVPYRLTIVHAKYYLPLYHSRPIFACACAIVDVRHSNTVGHASAMVHVRVHTENCTLCPEKGYQTHCPQIL